MDNSWGWAEYVFYIVVPVIVLIVVVVVANSDDKSAELPDLRPLGVIILIIAMMIFFAVYGAPNIPDLIRRVFNPNYPG